MLIVGAGIAWPATAIALHIAGIESVVYDASPEPRDKAGVFMNLAQNGLRVLDALGVSAQADRLAFANDRLVFHNDRAAYLPTWRSEASP